MGQKRKRGKSTEQWYPINPPDKKKTEKRKKKKKRGEKKRKRGQDRRKNEKGGRQEGKGEEKHYTGGKTAKRKAVKELK